MTVNRTSEILFVSLLLMFSLAVHGRIELAESIYILAYTELARIYFPILMAQSPRLRFYRN